MAKLSKTAIAAQAFRNLATALGWTVMVRNGVLTISKKIKANDDTEYARADMEYSSILDLARQTRSGTVWGTNSSGIGALSAMKYGVFTMHKSGVSKRLLTALAA